MTKDSSSINLLAEITKELNESNEEQNAIMTELIRRINEKKLRENTQNNNVFFVKNPIN
jgi:predicted Fe-S protein YdhL (DUF1289 family)